jgi:hypothetical protein
MSKDEALLLALEALEYPGPSWIEARQPAITAIKAALEAKDEPVAWMHPDGRLWTFGRGFDKATFTIPLYTTPPQRTWVGLTDEQIRACIASEKYAFEIVRAAEAKLKEKNT